MSPAVFIISVLILPCCFALHFLPSPIHHHSISSLTVLFPRHILDHIPSHFRPPFFTILFIPHDISLPTTLIFGLSLFLISSVLFPRLFSFSERVFGDLTLFPAPSSFEQDLEFLVVTVAWV